MTGCAFNAATAKQVVEERPETLRACLVQSDLIQYIAKADGKESEEIREKVMNASKITFLGANTTWLIFDGKKRALIVTVEGPSELKSWISPNISLVPYKPEMEQVGDQDYG